jgi:hypothetical protein
LVLIVQSGKPWATAVAAIIRSIDRDPRALRPIRSIAFETRPYARAGELA